MNTEEQVGRYAVIGNPVKHSKSPMIHAAFAAQFGRTIDYRAIEAPLDGFDRAINEFCAEGGAGCNVTVPFKQAAWQLADTRSGRAELAGAVNTLKFTSEGIAGDNTDGIGLLRDLTLNIGAGIHGQRILVLGAGGAVRGIVGALLEQAPKNIVIANRTPAKAEEIARVFVTIGPIVPSAFEALDGQQFDLVINGTAASLAGELPPIPAGIIAPGGIAYDLMYGVAAEPFLAWAIQHGASQAVDGLGMLVEQAAESFRFWFGDNPDTGPVIAAIRAQL